MNLPAILDYLLWFCGWDTPAEKSAAKQWLTGFALVLLGFAGDTILSVIQGEPFVPRVALAALGLRVGAFIGESISRWVWKKKTEG